MDFQIAAILAQDGLANGAIYMLLALALVLLFAVTRVLFFPQGDLVVFGALSFALLQQGRLPPSAWLLLGLGVLTFIVEQAADNRALDPRRALRSAAFNLGVPLLVLAACWWAADGQHHVLVPALLSVALVAPMGPMLYRLAFQPAADASILTLMIIAVALHFVLVGLGLFFFGPEGMRAPALAGWSLALGGQTVPAQVVIVCATALAVVAGLYLLFEKTIHGKALRATSVSRRGARLLGIRTQRAGSLAFALAAAISAVCGVLTITLTTVYYDSGLTLGLKGFIGAVIGAVSSFPGAALGALAIGLIDAFAAFFASSLKEAILFLLIIPVLLYLSLAHPGHGSEED